MISSIAAKCQLSSFHGALCPCQTIVTFFEIATPRVGEGSTRVFVDGVGGNIKEGVGGCSQNLSTLLYVHPVIHGLAINFLLNLIQGVQGVPTLSDGRLLDARIDRRPQIGMNRKSKTDWRLRHGEGSDIEGQGVMHLYYNRMVSNNPRMVTVKGGLTRPIIEATPDVPAWPPDDLHKGHLSAVKRGWGCLLVVLWHMLPQRVS